MVKVIVRKTKGGPGSGNFGHGGRPGSIGGSTSKGGSSSASSAASMQGRVTAPSARAFLKDGNPGRGGDTPLPSGWKRTSAEDARTFVMLNDTDGAQVRVSYHNGNYASLNMDKVSNASSLSKAERMYSELPPTQTSRIKGGGLIEWDLLQKTIDDALSGA